MRHGHEGLLQRAVPSRAYDKESKGDTVPKSPKATVTPTQL